MVETISSNSSPVQSSQKYDFNEEDDMEKRISYSSSQKKNGFSLLDILEQKGEKPKFACLEEQCS